MTVPVRREDDVFDQLGREQKPLPITPVSAPTTIEDRVGEIAESTADEAFAENVDQTLRLLTEQSG